MPTLSATGPVAKAAPAADTAAADRSGSPEETSAEFQGLLLALAGLALPATPIQTPAAGQAPAPDAAPVAAAVATQVPGLPVALADGTAAAQPQVPAEKLTEAVTAAVAPAAVATAAPAEVPAAKATEAPAAPAGPVALPATAPDAVPAEGKATDAPAALADGKSDGTATGTATGTDGTTDGTTAATTDGATAGAATDQAAPQAATPHGNPGKHEGGREGKPGDDQPPAVVVPVDPTLPAGAQVAPEVAVAPSPVDGQPVVPEAPAVPVQGVQAPAQVATADQVVPTAAPERATPAAPAQQLAAEIVPLRDKHGEHTLTLALHPADLGPVTITARVTGTDIQLDLGGATESGREAIRAALPDLRRELERAGFTSCLLDTNAGGSTGERRTPWYLPRPAESGSDTDGSRAVRIDPVATARTSRPAAGVLDLHA